MNDDLQQSPDYPVRFIAFYIAVVRLERLTGLLDSYRLLVP